MPIHGYVGLYEVSTYGRVRSLSRRRSDGRRVNSRVLKLIKNRDGHLRATLARDGKMSHYFVHRLVLSAFIGSCPDGMQGCHNNGDPADNHLSNLRWDSCKGNLSDRRHHGTNPDGERNPNAELTENQVRRCFRLRSQGWTYKKIANETNVGWAQIWNILRGRSWRQIYEQERASLPLPRRIKCSSGDIDRIKDLLAYGYKHKEIADWLGVSTGTISKIRNEMR